MSTGFLSSWNKSYTICGSQKRVNTLQSSYAVLCEINLTQLFYTVYQITLKINMLVFNHISYAPKLSNVILVQGSGIIGGLDVHPGDTANESGRGKMNSLKVFFWQPWRRYNTNYGRLLCIRKEHGVNMKILKRC